jgi:hypothetical protein
MCFGLVRLGVAEVYRWFSLVYPYCGAPERAIRVWKVPPDLRRVRRCKCAAVAIDPGGITKTRKGFGQGSGNPLQKPKIPGTPDDSNPLSGPDAIASPMLGIICRVVVTSVPFSARRSARPDPSRLPEELAFTEREEQKNASVAAPAKIHSQAGIRKMRPIFLR